MLGTSLTTVNPNETKKDTKVFAGGAQIATDDGTIVWKTADPVTGTSALYAGDGTTAIKEEETEPLGGQSIELTQPPSYNSSYSEVLGKAGDPQWQCSAAKDRYGDGDFWDLPIHCQEAIALTFEFRFDMVVVRPDSPTKAATAANGGVGHEGQAATRDTSSRILASTITTTSKGPSADSDAIGCDPNDPDNPCAVDVYAPMVDVTDTGVIEAGTDVTKDSLLAFRVFLADPVNKDCKSLAEKFNLQTAAGAARYIDPTGDAKLLATSVKALGDTSGSNASLGAAMAGDAQHQVDAHTIWDTGTVYVNGIDTPDLGYVIFHEALHLAFHGNHIAIAKALGLVYQKEEATVAEEKKAAEERALGNKDYKPKTTMQPNDRLADESIRKFLDNHCK